MPTINEIKVHFGEKQARLLNELFGLPAKAQQVDVSMSAATKESLGARDFHRLRAAEGAVFAEAERERLKTRYPELDLELRAGIEVRLEEIEQELSPKNASFRDFAAAAEASPETLISAMDLAFSAGDKDAALLSFAAGMQRDLEEVVSHGLTLRDDWAGLYGELTEGANALALDPGDRFEVLAPPALSKNDILAGPQNDIDFFASLR